MDDGNSWMGILIMGAALMVYFLIYGFGSAVQALNTSLLEDERDEGNQRAERLLHIQENPYRFIRTNQLITMLLSLMVGAYSLPLLKDSCETMLSARLADGALLSVPAKSAIGAAVLLLLAMAMVCFGIMIPKRQALKSPIRFCCGILPAIELLMKMFRPFTWLMETVSYVILRLMGIDIHAKTDKVTEEDIMYMVNEGHDQGVLEASEAEMITNIFEFDDKVTSDIMVHRKNVVALDGEMSLRETMDFMIKESINSRIPVYEEDIDNIIGILHIRDLLAFAERTDFFDTAIKEIDELLREPHFVPEHKNINALFKEMQSEKTHMEIVVDEYGQTAGIVTMEDILEEIVGNIMDEYDEEEPDIISAGNDTFQLFGMATLTDVEDALGIEFEEEDKENFDTLNGFLISRLGHLPEIDEKAEIPFGDYRFQIVEVENKIIKLVDAKRFAEQMNDGPES